MTAQKDPRSEKDPKFEALLDYLKRTRGFDFTGYKRPSLIRRMLKRLPAVGVVDFVDYMDYLEVHPEEFAQLFNSILINVTSFFRDDASWECLTEKIIPLILAEKSPDEPIRVWSAGCASGEEAYSLAIVFAEALGADAVRRRVKIYATDVDEEALAQARQAAYTEKVLEPVRPEWRKKYFEPSDGRYMFNPDLRRQVIFGHHDLIQDAPISRLDLLVCRNTLMYLNAETQGKILGRFHFALNDKGYLFLGKAEMLLTHSNLFNPVEMRCRVFSKTPLVAVPERLQLAAQANDVEVANQLGRHARLRELAFDTCPIARLVVDMGGTVMFANERLRSMFGVRVKDLGRPLQDMELSYRPVELRSLMERAIAERRPAVAVNVERHVPGEDPRVLDVQVVPLFDNGGIVAGISISFDDVTRYARLQQELQRSHQEIETAYEELQSTHEELETTNEELQSTNEELETTNEELQSTNEELETMNEELQSTNEELETMNNELRERSNALDRSNTFLNSILAGMHSGVIVVDREFNVLIWNQRAQDQWGLRAEEVTGHSLLTLEIGLPVEKLKGPIRDFLKGKPNFREAVLPAVNRRGKAVQCRITISPYIASDGERIGAVLLVEEVNKK